MALSEQTTKRFTDYVTHADMADTTFGHDAALLDLGQQVPNVDEGVGQRGVHFGNGLLR